MTAALLYLELTTRKNALWRRVQRLRNPRYLGAALVGAAYFYFFIFRGFRAGAGPHASPLSHVPLPTDPGAFESLGAFLFFVAAALSWLLARGRAALSFTETEVAFLFPAPVSRRTLIHYKLIKAQAGILVFSLLMTFLSRRWTVLGGNGWIHAGGWWIIISLFNLHMIGASFLRDRLLDLGLNPARRRWLAGGLLALLGLVTWLWVRRTLPTPEAAAIDGPEALLRYVQLVLATPPLAWLLYPFRLVVRPFLATSAAGFLVALGPAALLYAAHYWWVLRADVAFEEASLALAQKRTERVAAMKAGRFGGRQVARKRRREPFRLGLGGPRPVAFLWKGMIDAGPLYYPQSWLIAGAALIAGVVWLKQDPVYRPFVQGIGGVAAFVGGYAFFIGPMLVRRGLNRTVERFEVLKSYPLRGWQIVLGELLCPIALLSAFEWIMLSLVALCSGALHLGTAATGPVITASAAGLAVLTPPLAGLLFAVPFAGLLYFPAWLGAMGQVGGGIEVMGQRLLFFAAYVIVALVALLPAACAAVLSAGLMQWLADNLPLAILTAGLGAAVALLAEFAAVLWWLGGRFEQFDLSSELPR